MLMVAFETHRSCRDRHHGRPAEAVTVCRGYYNRLSYVDRETTILCGICVTLEQRCVNTWAWIHSESNMIHTFEWFRRHTERCATWNSSVPILRYCCTRTPCWWHRHSDELSPAECEAVHRAAPAIRECRRRVSAAATEWNAEHNRLAVHRICGISADNRLQILWG